MLTGQLSFFHRLGTEASENQTHSENEKYVWLSWELNYKATPPRLRRGKAVMSGCRLLVHLLVLSDGLRMERSVVAPHSQQNAFQSLAARCPIPKPHFSGSRARRTTTAPPSPWLWELDHLRRTVNHHECNRMSI